MSGFRWFRVYSDGSQSHGYEGHAPDGTRYAVEALGGPKARKGHQAKGPDGARIGSVHSKALDAKAECEKHYKNKKEAA